MNDPAIAPIFKAKEKGARLSKDEVKGLGPESRRLDEQWNLLTIQSSRLYRQFIPSDGASTRLQLVTPNNYRPEILQELHAGSVSGHLGEYKTCNTLQQRFYWPGLTRDVKIWCRTCPSCTARKTPSPNKHAPLQTIRAGAPMQIVAVDILGPLPKGPTGNSYILVAMDYFTKWAEVYAVPN